MKKTLYLIGIAILLGSCATTSRTSQTQKQTPDVSKSETTINATPKTYLASATRTIDIIHTKLDVSFNWEKQYLYGKAYITLKPYFYPIKDVVLNAQGFEIKTISLSEKNPKALLYDYDKLKLKINLDKEYTKNDTIQIFIDYIAKPNEKKSDSGVAIASDKGLYFINPLGDEKNKPTQLWTQGEPESNSSWFPTVDKPNERMTQEIYITLDSVHKKFVTLSNGLLISSKENKDKSRTDYWKQSLPAAPYLTMMAIGDFVITKDKWRTLNVDYYMEREYAPHAKAIFGNTPEMIEFFSNKLGVIYPWEKFSQVVVRDYISGAMENTSAVLHGEFFNQTDRELLDKNSEDVISHELFHQWFGDYVTCESWSNITMNEGFATYGEYLWKEYKYGRDAADQIGYESMEGYLSAADKKPKHLIRYNYNKPDDVFDAHSYNKGGAVLHMLRKYVGDDAFFAALKLYLEKNKFSSVEAADLRLTFEKVTGEDLKWFFDQWYFELGQPTLRITHQYIDSLKKYVVKIEQQQDLQTLPLFKIPIDVDIYSNQTKERKRIWVNQQLEEFSFELSAKPDLVNVDAEKNILCIKEEKLSIPERVFQYQNCPLYQDRLEALQECANFPSIPQAADIILLALKDKNSDLRDRAISYLEKLPNEYSNKVKIALVDLAKNDEKSTIRALAIEALASKYQDDELTPIYQNGIKDRSYAVAGASLIAISKKDEKTAMQFAKEFENEKSTKVLLSVANLYSQHGTDENNGFFVKLHARINEWENIPFANSYTEFLKRCSDDTINAGIKILERIALMKDSKWVRYFGQKGIKTLAEMYSDREEQLNQEIKKLKLKQNNESELKTLEQQLVQAQNQKQKITTLYNTVKAVN